MRESSDPTTRCLQDRLAVVSRDAGDSPEIRADQQRGVVVPTSDGNFQRAPSADILRTPVCGTLTAASLLEGQLLSIFADFGPVLLEQLGLQAEKGKRKAARVVNEGVLSYQPLVAHFIGVDTNPVRAAIEENTVVADALEKETTLYMMSRRKTSRFSAGRMSTGDSVVSLLSSSKRPSPD